MLRSTLRNEERSLRRSFVESELCLTPTRSGLSLPKKWRYTVGRAWLSTFFGVQYPPRLGKFLG